MNILLHLQKSKVYWLLKHNFKNVKIYIAKSLHIYKWSDKKESYDKPIIQIFTVDFLPNIIFSFLFVSLLLWVEYCITKIHLTENNNWLICITNKYLSLNMSILQNSNAFMTFLQIGVSIAGVFLALYFNGISIVISSAYTKAPARLRYLVVTEEVGRTFTKLLLFYISICFLLLAFNQIGHKPGLIIISILTFLSCLVVYSMFYLGGRTFDFFEPNKFSKKLFNELYASVRQATIKGFRHYDQDFQDKYYRQTYANIKDLENIIEFYLNSEVFKDKELSSLIYSITSFLIVYSYEKYIIPQNSYWYPRTPKYKDWLLANSSDINSYRDLQMYENPKMEPNYYWLENEFIDIVAPCIIKLLQSKKFDKLYSIINYFRQYFKILGANLDIKYARTFLNKFENIFDSHFEKQVIQFEKGSNYEIELHTVYEILCTEIILGYFTNTRASSQVIINSIDNLNWKINSGITNQLPYTLFETIEYIRKGLDFEVKIEGKTISPISYRRELIIRKYLELLAEGLDQIMDLIKSFYIDKADILLKSNNYILFVFHSKSGLESVTKVKMNLKYLQEITKIEQYKVNPDLKWPKWDWENKEKKIDEIRDKIIENLAKSMILTIKIDRKDSYPDLFGQTYQIILDECYDILKNKKFDKIEKIFGALLLASLYAHDSILKKLQIDELKNLKPEDFENTYLGELQSKLIYYYEPIYNLVELSGYAIIYSSLYKEPELWNNVKKIWDLYIVNKPKEQKNAIISTIIKACEYKESVYAMAPGDIRRTSWEINLNQQLREMKLFNDDWTVDIPPEPTDNELINFIIDNYHGLSVPPKSIFIFGYLLKMLDDITLDVKDPWGISDVKII